MKINADLIAQGITAYNNFGDIQFFHLYINSKKYH